MKSSGKTLAEREGLQSVIDNARKSAAAGYPDFTGDDPATFVADFIVEKEREGMSLAQALGDRRTWSRILLYLFRRF